MNSIRTELLAAGVGAHELPEPRWSQVPDVWPIGIKTRPPEREPRPVVVRPSSVVTVQRVLPWAAATGRHVLVHGGRSNVVGSLQVIPDVVLDMTGLNAIRGLDEISQTVTAEAGVLGGELEGFLESRALTLGHYPQSLVTSTVGGWIATRATGTASAAFGGIECMVRGLEFVLPSGELVEIAPRPRAAGGLDSIALMCGSEGSLGVITQATLSTARRLPQRRLAAAFPRFEAALDAQRKVIQARLPIGVLRTLNATESAAIAPPGTIDPGSCLLIASIDGEEPLLDVGEQLLARSVVACDGVVVDPTVADGWWAHRYAPAGLIEGRNERSGELFDTIEVGTTWAAAAALSAMLERELGQLVQTLWLHASHAYATGTCLYLAFWIVEKDDPSAVEACRTVWQRALEIVRDHGGSPGHHHGIGAARSGIYGDSPEGRLHRLVKAAVDPHGVLSARLLAGSTTAAS